MNSIPGSDAVFQLNDRAGKKRVFSNLTEVVRFLEKRMIFDLMSQESDLASARRAAGFSEQDGTGRVLQRIFWRYFLMAWCLAGMALGLKALAIGVFLIWLGHPVLIGMRLSSLVRRNRVVLDSGQHDWFVSMGGVTAKEKIISLKNVFFYSQEVMKSVLTGFCRVRLLLYVTALLVAAYDVHGQWSLPATDHRVQVTLAMAVANLVFFTYRSITYFRLLVLGQRQTWHVGTVVVDSQTMFAAYTRCRSRDDEFYVPYLLAVFTPQVALPREARTAA